MSGEYRSERQRELKFPITADVAEAIRAWARVHLLADPHGGGAEGDWYHTTSIYFDTAEMDTFHRRGSYRRAKYRVRRYGASDLVVLERKLKARGLVAKRRSFVPISELHLLDAALSTEDPWMGAWFGRRVQARHTSPVCQVSYDRTARVGTTPTGPMRLTIDENVRAEVHPGSAPEISALPGALVAEGLTVLELKYRSDMPLLFKQLATEFSLKAGAVSKYRLAAVALGLSGEEPRAECSVAEDGGD